MVWNCALPVYKYTATRSRQSHLKVILNGLTNDKKSTFVKFFQFDFEMTLRLPWHDLEEKPS